MKMRLSRKLAADLTKSSVTLFAVGFIVAGLAVNSAGASTPESVKTETTASGYSLSVSGITESFSAVPNLAGSPTSKEAFFDEKGGALISGDGKEPIDTANLEIGYQVGCPFTLGGVTINSNIGVQPSVGAQIGIGGVAAGPQIGLDLGSGAGITLNPGQIAEVSVAAKPMQSNVAEIALSGIHVNVDGCIGPVTLRPYYKASISTGVDSTSVTAYGPIREM